MLQQIINMVMRQIVRQGVNTAMRGGTNLVKSQMEKQQRKSQPPQRPEADGDDDTPPPAR
jgi:hypothetical protein